jgi:hypothetical protein
MSCHNVDSLEKDYQLQCTMDIVTFMTKDTKYNSWRGKSDPNSSFIGLYVQ